MTPQLPRRRRRAPGLRTIRDASSLDGRSAHGRRRRDVIDGGQTPIAGAFLNRKPRATANGAAPYLPCRRRCARRRTSPADGLSRSSSPREGGTVRGRGARCARGCVRLEMAPRRLEITHGLGLPRGGTGLSVSSRRHPSMAATKTQPTEIQMAAKVPTRSPVSAASPTRRRMLG